MLQPVISHFSERFKSEAEHCFDEVFFENKQGCL